MAFANFETLFSRQFVIGFLAGPLSGVFLLSQLLSEDWLPSGYRSASASAQVVIVGAVAVFVALLLGGLYYLLLRLLEGYPMQDAPLLARWYGGRVAHWQQQYDELAAIRDDASKSGAERTRAALRLNDSFPARRALVLPTQLGNVVRAFETHPRNRYGLDGIAVWPRVSLLLSAEEQGVIDAEATNVQFFVSLIVVALSTGAILAADVVAHTAQAGWALAKAAAVVAVALLVAEVSRRCAVDAARGWGESVRAAIDLHRRELYERLGVALPDGDTATKSLGNALDQMILFGTPIPDGQREWSRQE